MSDVAPTAEQIAELLALAEKATPRPWKDGFITQIDDLLYARAACNLSPALARRVQELEQQLNTPELQDFAAGVVSEAQHQRARWGSEHNAGKTAADWFWLIGYLAQKAMYAQLSGDTDKALHHTISTAAALANWHAAISGESTVMRPGISEEKQNAV